MKHLSKIITAFTLGEFINEIYSRSGSPNDILTQFSEECELLGGDKRLFVESALRELEASGILNEEGESTPVAANNTAGVAGTKPEDLAVSVLAQKRHNARNNIFRRKKPNTYFVDKKNNY